MTEELVRKTIQAMSAMPGPFVVRTEEEKTMKSETEEPRRVIVSGHPAAVEFVRREAPEFADTPVLAVAGPEDVRDKVVAGNLPLHLAALCHEVVAVEFTGAPPRGREYGLAEMDAAGARLARYVVRAVSGTAASKPAK